MKHPHVSPNPGRNKRPRFMRDVTNKRQKRQVGFLAKDALEAAMRNLALGDYKTADVLINAVHKVSAALIEDDFNINYLIGKFQSMGKVDSTLSKIYCEALKFIKENPMEDYPQDVSYASGSKFVVKRDTKAERFIEDVNPLPEHTDESGNKMFRGGNGGWCRGIDSIKELIDDYYDIKGAYRISHLFFHRWTGVCRELKDDQVCKKQHTRIEFSDESAVILSDWDGSFKIGFDGRCNCICPKSDKRKACGK
jgi:hypothetical protein